VTTRPSQSEPLTLEELESVAGRAVGTVARLTAIAGDASTRRFFRVARETHETLIAMVLEKPFDERSHPQVLVGRYLESIGFPVPRLEASVPEAGVLFYEDLGDTLLQDVAREQTDANEVARLYAEAVGLIAILQGPGTQRLPAGHPSALSALDKDRFLYELEFFREHYIAGLRGLTLEAGDDRLLRDFFEDLAGAAASPPRVLCHRDYHSRNLLVKDGSIRVVDFQDARLGPAAYDLASLLRDCYVVLPSRLREEMLDLFQEKAATGVSGPRFRESFDIVALQRHLKAIGTFAYQASVLGRDRYLESIPATWSYVRDEIARLPAYRDAARALERFATFRS